MKRRAEARSIAGMELRSLTEAEPFTTKDGSTIRELHHTPAQSLAEASPRSGQATERHYHAQTEEIYLVTGGRRRARGGRRVARRRVGRRRVIPPGAWHELVAGTAGARFWCMCAPPYSHDDTYFA